MRLKNIPNAKDAVNASPFCIKNPTEQKGSWRDLFQNDHPLALEVGMGKGQFLMTLAETFPEINYLGMERYTSVIYRALQKYEVHPLNNLRFLCEDAAELLNFFAPGEVSTIYLNFSDPWPKDRHAKRRLTYRAYWDRYRQILAKDGRVEFKTDNVGLFDFSLEEAAAAHWEIEAFTKDLHHDPLLNEGNIMTEYEERFSAKGNPICKLIARPR